jgi:hypothetical protein
MFAKAAMISTKFGFGVSSPVDFAIKKNNPISHNEARAR